MNEIVRRHTSKEPLQWGRIICSFLIFGLLLELNMLLLVIR